MPFFNEILERTSKYKFEIVLSLFILSILSFLTFNYSILYVNGDSMQPTYFDKDIVVVKKTKVPKKNDLIVFELPKSWGPGSKKLIKRVFALENDKIILDHPIVELNDTKFDFSNKKCASKEFQEVELKSGEYFVVGDNIENSNDSYFQFCEGNNDFIVHESKVAIYGKEVFVIGGFKWKIN